MRYFCALTLLLTAFLPAAGLAQVEVRSGEHPGFTRLVFYFENLEEWRLGRTDSGYGFLAESAQPDFDISGVFDFIPRSRIRDIMPVPGGLEIQSDCECYVNAYEYQPGILVLDVRDGTALANSSFEASLTVNAQEEQQDNRVAFPLLFQGDRPSTGMPMDTTASGSRQSATQPLNTIEFPMLPEVSSGHSQLEQQLVEQFGRALSQGLLTSRETAAPEAVIAQRADRDQEPNFDVPTEGEVATTDVSAELSENEVLSRNGLDQLPNVRVHNAMDFGNSAKADGQDVSCVSGRHFTFFDNVNDASGAPELSSARAAFLDDLTAPAPAAVTLLAQAYIGLGFGAEASQILLKYGSDGRQDAILRSLAELVDSPQKGINGTLRSQIDCDTAASVWALLAHGTDMPEGNVNADAIVRTVSAWPIHLRRHLVPTISERLRRLKLDNAAEAVRETVIRADDAVDTPLALEIEMAEPDVTSSESTRGTEPALSRASLPTSPVAEKAATAMLAQLEELGNMASNDLLLQVAAEIHSTRGSADGQALLEGYMTALGRQGLTDPAINMISRLGRSRFADAYDLENASAIFLKSMTEHTQTGAFVVGAMALLDGDDLPSIPLEARFHAAARLEGLGLEEQSFAFRTTQGAELRPAAGQDDVVADAGEPQGIGSFDRFPSTDEPPTILEDEGQSAWLNQDWAEAQQSLPDGPRRRLASQLAQGSAPDPLAQGAVGIDAGNTGLVAGTPVPQVSLAETREVLSQSSALRRDLEELGLTADR